MVEYVGLDVSKEETAYCVKDADGKILAQGKVATDPDALFAVLKEHCVCPERIVLETGTQSNWLARELGKRGLPVQCLDARRAHAVLRLRHNKTDANDAEAWRSWRVWDFSARSRSRARRRSGIGSWCKRGHSW